MGGKISEILGMFLPDFSGLTTGVIPVLLALVIFSSLYAALKRYVRCPADKILVISGRTGSTDGQARQAKCIHGGGTIVWPIVQEYHFLDLKPFSVGVDLRDALTKQNIRVNIPSSFTIGISTAAGVMENAAQRLLGLKQDAIQSIAAEIIIGQLRSVLASMTIEEINADREGFMTRSTQAIGTELNKVGLHLINVNIKDIVDESGYIKALGQKAAATAIQTARQEVAQEETRGGIGVAETDREKRIKTAAANATAVEGENTSAVAVAQSLSKRQIAEAEATRDAEAAKREAEAKVEERMFIAEEAVQLARARREKAERTALEVVAAEVAKEATVVAASADAEAAVLRAKGEAEGALAKRQAEAKGIQAILEAQAAGMKLLVEAAGGDARVALGMLIQRQLPELARINVDAVKGLKFDKVVVMGGSGQDSGVPGFVNGLFRTMPGLKEQLETVGMQLPDWLVQGGMPPAATDKPAPAEAPKQLVNGAAQA